MQNFQLDYLHIFELLKVSPYTPYAIVGLCFLILVIIHAHKVKGKNKKKKMLLIETHKNDIPSQNESSNHAVSFEGEVFDLTHMDKRQIREIKWILRFLPLFFFSTMLIVFVSPLLWPIPFVGLLGIFFVTILGAIRMQKYGHTRDYISGQELLDQLNERKNLNFKSTVLMNQVELLNNVFNYLSCRAHLKLNDRVSSTWTLYVSLRAITDCNYTLNNSVFSVDKKRINIPTKLRESIKTENIRKITDFLMDEDDEKLCFSIESWETYLIAKIRFAIKEPQRVTNASIERVIQSFELLEEVSLKILQNLQE